MAKAIKKTAKKASETFHNIMAASVKPKSKKNMSTIDLQIGNKTYTFSYTITKTSDKNKVDRFWNFDVTYKNDDLEQLSKSFSFKHDTLNNVTEGKIGTLHEFVSEQIMMKELS